MTRLYRPVGPRELQKIAAAQWRGFPPRRAEQPIFYPVCNFEYAWMIAHDWNMPSADVGYAGYVTEFDVDTSYVERFEIHVAGGGVCQELWVPAEELGGFNEHIEPPIRVVAWSFHEQFCGVLLQGRDLQEQRRFLESLPDDALLEALKAHGDLLAVNLPHWLPDATRVMAAWERVFPGTIVTTRQ